MAKLENHSLAQALAELEKVAPQAPLLALGQTVFWDEPMKAGVAGQAMPYRRFIAAIHDTDYFAKVPGVPHLSAFRTLAHNDTTTKGLWSAAGEFSALFGSETVVSKEALLAAGLRLDKLQKEDPHVLDHATEAWGWRGIASLSEHPPITAEIDAQTLSSELLKTLDWAVETSLECAEGASRLESTKFTAWLKDAFCDQIVNSRTVGDLYERLLPQVYAKLESGAGDLETSRTTELLRFNTRTCSLPRFKLVEHFANPDSREEALRCYNEAIAGSGLYGTSRFGTGAIPFDLVIPGHGRGTLRIGRNGIVVQTPIPQFASFPKGFQLNCLSDLAQLVEKKFGPDCVLIGKAVTLIGMLASEFVFVFHEGASGYVPRSTDFHRRLSKAGLELRPFPLLRVRYHLWESLKGLQGSMQLPEPFRKAFGAESISYAAFAGEWHGAVAKAESTLSDLAKLRRPLQLIEYLAVNEPKWVECAEKYVALNHDLGGLREDIQRMKEARAEQIKEMRRLRAKLNDLEKAKGDHFRAQIFEKSPSSAELGARERFIEDIRRLKETIGALQNDIHKSIRAQRETVRDERVAKLRERRSKLELSAERARLALIRDAYTTAKGLKKANLRPSFWWLPILSPDGQWFRAVTESAECYLEHLI